MKNRSRLEISAEVLRQAINGEKKTRLMYQTNLSYDSLKDYLGMLTSKGLLNFNKENGLYMTTHKGRTFLVRYEKLSSVLGDSKYFLSILLWVGMACFWHAECLTNYV
jgi:predicted transcriptional regulator